MRRLDSLLLAGVGILVVHQIAYAAATVSGFESTTPHGHLAFAWLTSSLAALFALARCVTRSLKRRHHVIGARSSFTTAIAVGYVILEVAERALDGVEVASLLGEPVVWLGLLAAPIVAAGLALSIRSVERLVFAATASKRHGLVASAAPTPLWATSVELCQHLMLSFVVSRRGPPAALQR